MSGDYRIKRVSKAIAWLLIVLFLAGALFVMIRLTNGGTDDFKTFYVERDGKIFAQEDSLRAIHGSEVKFNVNYTFSLFVDEPRDFSVEVVSCATQEAAFTYSVDGTTYRYSDDMDMTSAFDVETNIEGGFFTVRFPDTMKTALEAVYGGAVELSEEPNTAEYPYFKILVTSYNKESTICISVYLIALNIADVEFDSEGIVFWS